MKGTNLLLISIICWHKSDTAPTLYIFLCALISLKIYFVTTNPSYFETSARHSNRYRNLLNLEPMGKETPLTHPFQINDSTRAWQLVWSINCLFNTLRTFDLMLLIHVTSYLFNSCYVFFFFENKIKCYLYNIIIHLLSTCT